MVSSSLLSMSTGMLVSGFLDWELSVDRTGSKAAEHREEQTKQIDLSTSTKMSEVLRDKKNLGLGRTPEQQEMSLQVNPCLAPSDSNTKCGHNMIQQPEIRPSMSGPGATPLTRMAESLSQILRFIDKENQNRSSDQGEPCCVLYDADCVQAKLFRFLEECMAFQKAGKNMEVTLGYHYTNQMYLSTIREHGLLTRAERRHRRIRVQDNGSSFGDGIYTVSTVNNSVDSLEVEKLTVSPCAEFRVRIRLRFVDFALIWTLVFSCYDSLETQRKAASPRTDLTHDLILRILTQIALTR